MQTPEQKKAKKAAYMKVYHARVRAEKRPEYLEKDREHSRNWREKNKDRVRAYDSSRKDKALKRLLDWRQKNPDFKLRENHRRRARKLAGGELSKGIRKFLIARQDGLCAICGGVPNKWHLDHVVPLSRGGKNEDDNVQMTCHTCNMKKGAKINPTVVLPSTVLPEIIPNSSDT